MWWHSEAQQDWLPLQPAIGHLDGDLEVIADAYLKELADRGSGRWHDLVRPLCLLVHGPTATAGKSIARRKN